MIIAQLQTLNTIREQSHSIQEHTDYPLHKILICRRHFVNRFMFIEFWEEKRGEDEAADYSGFNANLHWTCLFDFCHMHWFYNN